MCTEPFGRRAARCPPWPRVIAVAGIVLLAACNGTTSYMDATGTAGRHEATLGWWLTGVSVAVVAFVSAAIIAGIARHRGERNEPREGNDAQRREVKSGLNWIYAGITVTIVILAISFAGTMVTLNAASRPRITPSLTLDVTAHQWWWEVTYAEANRPGLGFTTANEVHLPVGVPVRVRLHSADVIHSFWLPQIAGKMDVIPGQVNETWLEARQAGTSRGMCGEYCGLEHAVMALEVTAESPSAFARWASEHRAAARAPTSAAASAGRVVFARSCGVCHAVAGTPALGRVGPDLTHLASRSTIGAGALVNDAANLTRWIHDAPAVKEGVRMPAMPLSDAELHDVVAYLQTLH
jgi:cytochrome c oxidase subunit II